ncbi:kinase-like domain-containing protein [Lophiotrema nucula]|uniref:Kinase-like domain-containing protein n=1 Tax=Lophiotrema nucula TaxID=690887 RepID=A0A6A5YX35_9PLEO|nr:kinase-like domain-containing protein [Lophiotrema nucula]
MSILVDQELFQPTILTDTTFFQQQARLPTPQEVRNAAASPSRNPCVATRVLFPQINMFVKYGPEVDVAEAQCLRIVRYYLHSKVPTPEVFGWDKDGEDVFLYMQLMPGVPLSERWDSLSGDEKGVICDEIGKIMSNLRLLAQKPSETLIGSVTMQPIRDNSFQSLQIGQTGGPFRTVKEFHDWFSTINMPLGTASPYRSWLPDNHSVAFAHGDLHPDNIMISLDVHPPNIVSLVDFGQSGWYPDYWDYCKARMIGVPRSAWLTESIPRIFGRDLEGWWPYWSFFLERLGR